MNKSKNKTKKQQRKVQIFVSQYQGNESYYDFNSTDQKQFTFNMYETKDHNKLYIYQQKNKNQQIIISNTMDSLNQYRFLFLLQIKQVGNQYIFQFKNLRQVIKQNQAYRYSGQKLAERLLVKNNNNSKYTDIDNKTDMHMQDPKSRYNHLLSKPIQSYIEHNIQQIQQLWFVPRYMKPMQIQQNMILRYHFKTFQDIIVSRQIKVQKLVLTYAVQQVNIQQIKNNPDLARDNQQNLLHMCDPVKQKSDCDQSLELRQCVFCFDRYQDDFDKKYPNILVSACYCDGYVKYTHLKCLASWVRYNSAAEVFSCKTCHKPLPQYLMVSKIDQQGKIKSRFFKLIGENNGPFLTLNKRKILIYQKQQVTIGTKIGCQYYFSGNQSNSHSIIKYDPRGEKAWIEDSKQTSSGTLIKKENMRMAFEKVPNQPIVCSVLVNKVLFNITLYDGI